MIQWIETKDDKSYWMMNFTAKEMVLLRKYHKTITRLTKLDFSSIFREDKPSGPS
jgi:hypothetical protein